jgi:SAM-dependent methyltransferase
MRIKESFNNAAELYDRARPSCPEEIVDWIISKTNAPRDQTILEIGPGTGQATLPFAAKGYKIHCIELGDNLARMLLKNSANYNVTVDIAMFENWRPENNLQYPLIFSASAFHWLDEDSRYKRCYDLLKNNGHLALLWNVAPVSEISEVVQAFDLLRDYCPEKNAQKKPNIEIPISIARRKLTQADILH